MARTIAPNGHLYTFEFHEERAKAVKYEDMYICTSLNNEIMDAKLFIMLDYLRKDFEDHGLSDLITVECRDVCKDGFGITGLVHAGKSRNKNFLLFLASNFISIYY